MTGQITEELEEFRRFLIKLPCFLKFDPISHMNVDLHKSKELELFT